MSKKFTHSDFDRVSGCDWTFSSVDGNTEEVIDAAIEHLHSCDKGLKYIEVSNLLRATIRAVITDEKQKDASQKAV